MRKRSYGQYTARKRRAVSRAITLRGRRARRPYKPGYSRIGGYYGRYFPGSTELKFFDTVLSGSIDATGEVAPGGGTSTGIVLIGQGVTESTRVGRKCTIKSIQMKGRMTLATDTSSGQYNIALVWDKQANGAYPAYTDVFETDVPTAHLNLANSGRFVILKRWFGTMNQLTYNDTGAVFGQATKALKYYKKCNIPLEFSSTTGAITELRSNNLFLMWSSNVDDKFAVASNWRVRFSDD